MTNPTFEDETKIYDVMSKLASRAAMNSALQTIALIQKAMADGPNGPDMQRLAGDDFFTSDEQKIFDNFDKKTLNDSWRKLIKSVDIGIGFLPELDRVARTEAVLVRIGDKITGSDGQGFLNVLANWEIEIDLGIVRGKVSW